jgi:membrane associated rhomboid family serine protease
MFPLKDDVPTNSTPFVTVGLIAINVLVFLYQASLQGLASAEGSRAVQAFVLEFGLVPCRLTGNCVSPEGFPPPMVSMFTSMFLHGGLFHVAGNMLYLWIFGNNVEDTLGHVRFVVFYLACGIGAALGQTAFGPHSTVPMIGASGAVSGVLGAYLLLSPRANVLTLIVFGFFIRLVRIPAAIVLGLWFAVQFVNGLVTWSASGSGEAAGGGVAWFAHIGGFLVGMALLYPLHPRRHATGRARRSW